MNDKNVIKNYKYIKTIGEGTFGKVKLANHIITGEKVAIKILEKNLIKGKSEYKRIEREIKCLKSFNHPNIIQIYEVIENTSSFYIVMEYAPGGELFNYIIEQEKLTEKESSFYLYQIVQGIKEIHKKKICHRDIKPENLLFTKDKILKIIDFGLSKEYEDYLSTPCGSPCYASPEMIRGQNYNGLSVDLWACGIILFAMLCGYLPFDDSNNDVLFKKILECKIDYPDPVEDDIILSDNALDLINKILTLNPKNRIGIEEILEHPFLEYGKKEYNNVIKPDNFDQEALIIDYMINELGFMNKNNIIKKYIFSNNHNNITTTFKLLKKKFMEGRLNYTFKEKIMKQISKPDYFKNKLKNNLSNNNMNLINNSRSFINYSNSNCERNYSKKNVPHIENTFNLNKNKKKKVNDITFNNNINFSCNSDKRSKTISHSNSKKNITSLKDIIKHKDIKDRNNIIIINNTNMIHEPGKIKSIYNDIFFKHENLQNQFYRKIETSVSLEKSEKKNNLTTNILENKLNNTININNMNEQIKVCLKNDKKENPFSFFRKFNDNELIRKKKFIYLPFNNHSFKLNYKKIDKKNFTDKFISYKRNTTGMTGFINRYKNLYSLEGNNSNNFNLSTSKHLNALSKDNINSNLNFNSSKNDEGRLGSTSKHKKSNNNIKYIFKKNDIINKYKYKSINKASFHNLSNTIDINKENDNLDKSVKIIKKIVNGKINFRNIKNICKGIFIQNSRKNMNSNLKSSNDNDINTSNKNNYKINKENKNISNNNLYINPHLNKEKNIYNSNKEILNSVTNRPHRLNKSINNQLNNLNSKIIFKNILKKNIDPNITSRQANQNLGFSTIENNSNTSKIGKKSNNNLCNKYYRKINLESFRERNDRNKKLINKISTLKNLSPLSNKTNNNLNIVSKIIKKNKINKSIKEILSLKSNFRKNKGKMKYNSNIYKILQKEKNEKNIEKDKESIIIESTSRNNITTNSINNNIPISIKEKKAIASRNLNNDNMTKSNTIIIDNNNKFLSTERRIKKVNNIKELSTQNKDKEQNININIDDSSINENIIIEKRKIHNNVDKFLVANTEMTLYQISYKLEKFCKENNLNYKKEGLYNFIISSKNSQNFFTVEVTHSSPLNIVKFFHGTNTQNKMKEIITRLFIEIVNY